MSNRIITRRVMNEINELVPVNKKINIIFEETCITIIINNKTIILSPAYPFKSPEVFINNNKYTRFLYPPTNRIFRHMSELNIGCVCCSSIITKPINWVPTNTIQHILDEVFRVNNIKMKVKYSIAIEEICLLIQRITRKSINIDRVFLEFLFVF